MFTGIIECVGSVVSRADTRVEVQTAFEHLATGESVAVDGVCLTVTDFSSGRFTADISEETNARTTVKDWVVDQRVNLERPMAADGRFGGHIVQGHVDATAEIVQIDQRSGSVEMWFQVPRRLLTQVVEKGSIAVDGISLTVAAIEDQRFMVSLVPHTLRSTSLSSKEVGSSVNIETDIVARYVERMVHSQQKEGP